MKVVYRGKIPYKECEICGQFFKTKNSHLSRRKTCSKTCDNTRRKAMYKGENNPNYGNKGNKNPIYKGGFVSSRGYKLIKKPDHPNAGKDGYILEHRYVMSSVLGRPLREDEIVHHKDENRLNNDPDNLEVMSREDHSRLHSKDYFIIRDEHGRIEKYVRVSAYEINGELTQTTRADGGRGANDFGSTGTR